MRGRNLIAGLATLPLRCIDADRRPVRLPLLQQIDPNVPNVVTLAQTFEDLLFESVSWWRIVATGPGGYPTAARHVDVSAVSMTPPPGFPLYSLPSGEFPNGAVWVLGETVPSEQMIRFDSPNPPLLVHAARAIRRALKLELAAEMYADDPKALEFFTPTDGADPAEDEDIAEILDDWTDARRRRAAAYVPASLEHHTLDWMSPADLQLDELMKRATLALANAMGLDPEDFGISTTSRTYQNAVDRRQDRINECYSPYLSAVADRLSMGDVTPRTRRIVWDLDGFMRADPRTRWDTYKVAKDIGAIDVPEIREKEDMPVKEMPAPAIEQAPPSGGNVVPMPKAAAAARPAAVRFERATGITFEAPQVQAAFAVDESARTITGMAVPYGPTALSGWATWRFQRGCLKWSDTSRVKLLRDHDMGQPIGKAIKLEETDAGLMATFKVARGPRCDEVLSLAADGVLDGLSVGIDFEADGWQPDPMNEGCRLVTSAALREVSITPIPAFDSARVDAVTASAQPEGKFAMPCTSCGQVHAAGTPCPVAAPAPAVQAAAAPVAVPAQAPAGLDVAAFTAATEALTAATTSFAAAVEALGQMPAEHRQIVSAVRPGEGVQSEPLTYTLDGVGDSFVRDAWNARNASYGSKEAEEALSRLRRYGEQTAALAARATARFANAGNTTDQAQIIPPGYRPDLYVGQVPQGRPLFDSVGTRVRLVNATPFKVPVWVGSAGLSGTNSEGTGPSTGTITDHTYRTVSPTAQSGEFVVTRELMDSSNPVIDVIALNAMREEYSQDTEGVIATALAAATDDNTGSGQSTEGCYVYSVTGAGSDLAIDGAREMEADFVTHRFLAPDRLLASPTGFKALAKAVDDVGRPLFPYLGQEATLGTAGRAAQTLNVDGLAVPNCWSMTSTYDDLVLFNSVDVLAGESPLLTFRFEEKGGPENIYLNIWGYFCFQILRYTGIHACNYTAA